jgi:hypothetical protein
MLRRTIMILAAVCLFLTPVAGWADLAPYNQDFEGLVQSDPAALSDNGWLVFANVFSPDHATYYYGYGPFPAPNPGGGFSAIDAGQGGPDQGAQQLSVYSDYNNGDHANGNLIEANVFEQQTIGAADVGHTWVFEFDAKRGNIAGATTAIAFIKTLDPNNGYATTNFVTVDMTSVPDSWGHYSISLAIDGGLPGQLLQFGFANTATHYEGSGVFYDNLAFQQAVTTIAATVDIDPDVINLKSQAKLVTVYLELNGANPANIDVSSIRLAGSVATDAKFAAIGDHDMDTVPDLMVKFPRAALDPLLVPGMNTLEVTGTLVTGEAFSGSDMITVINPPLFAPAASVSPNPLNPIGKLSYRTSSPGPVSVKMFDINGRLVRTLVDNQILAAGTHEVTINGRGERGEILASGVYFFRVAAGQDVTTGRFSIMK